MEPSSKTFTVRVDPLDKERLETLAKSTGRSRSYLAAEAIANYLDVNEWQVAGIGQAVRSIEEGSGIDHRVVRDWVESWDGPNELLPPNASAA